MTLRLGIIGLSEGNGHPYSWSAIFNGYSLSEMENCGFPAIPQYLKQQRWPAARIPEAVVTHIWTQSPHLSSKIARAALIENVVAEPEAMLGHVDAVLLARDDAENHLFFAKTFIEAGLPVYIDKPVSLTVAQLDVLYGLQRYDGQIFTCSALRYASELQPRPHDYERIGQIRHVQATTPKSWEKYSVHIIEPVLRILGNEDMLASRAAPISATGRLLIAYFTNSVSAGFMATGDNVATPIAIRIHGDKGWLDFCFSDSFSAFKLALQDFVDGIRSRTCRSLYEFNRRVVGLVEAGLKNE